MASLVNKVNVTADDGGNRSRLSNKGRPEDGEEGGLW